MTQCRVLRRRVKINLATRTHTECDTFPLSVGVFLYIQYIHEIFEFATVSSALIPRVKLAGTQNDATSAQRRLLRQYRRGSQLYDHVFHVSAGHDRRGSLAAYEGGECHGKQGAISIDRGRILDRELDALARDIVCRDFLPVDYFYHSPSSTKYAQYKSNICVYLHNFLNWYNVTLNRKFDLDILRYQMFLRENKRVFHPQNIKMLKYI